MNWKTPITLLVLLGILLGAAFYGWQTIIAPDPTDEKTAKTDGKKKCDKKIVFKRGRADRSQGHRRQHLQRR